MQRKNLTRALFGSLLGLLSALLIWAFARFIAPELMYSFEAKTYDWRVTQRVAGVEEQSIDQIIIVDIDGRSVSKLGRYAQWDRIYYPRLLEYLEQGGAAAIGFDIIFDQDKWNPGQDSVFIAVTDSLDNIYNALYFGQSDSMNWRYRMMQEPEGLEYERFRYRLLDNALLLRQEERMENEFIGLLNASTGLGHVNFDADQDGVVRSIHLFTSFNQNLYPTLTLKMFMDQTGTDQIRLAGDSHLELLRQDSVQFRIPVNAYGEMLINYFGGFKTFRYISFYDVLEHRIPAEFFSGKYILVGTSLAGLFDLRSVPFLQAFPGVEIHANILNTLIEQKFVHRVSGTTSLIILAIFGTILGLMIGLFPPLISILISLLVAIGHIFISTVLLIQTNTWIEMLNPLLTIVVAFAAIYTYRFMTEERNKRFIRNTFSHFVTRSVVDELLANPDKIKLGGEKKNCTVFFSDVAGFTTISEQLQPEELVALLNEYLTAMTNIVFKYEGMLDKYEGDAIMAVFGAPIARGNHAYQACAAALEMQHKLVEMRHKWEKEGKPPLHARCGINTGWMVVGNMGSETRFDYTVMGDSVNLGARLEPANKEYDTLIMIGDQTYQQTKDLIITRPLDLLQVKGKTEPVKVYELVATRETGISDEKKRVLDLFQKGFDNYLKQNWDWAINYFQQALAVQKDDGPSRRYLQRASMFKENPPGADWDGSFRMTTK